MKDAIFIETHVPHRQQVGWDYLKQVNPWRAKTPTLHSIDSKQLRENRAMPL